MAHYCKCGKEQLRLWSRRPVNVGVPGDRITERHGRDYCVRVKHGEQPFRRDGYLSVAEKTPVTFTNLGDDNV